ncbi:hypothetical protein GCM10020331_074490 [Ectobacillus funiculus]
MSTLTLEKVKKQLKTLNNIAESGLNVFQDGFAIDNDSDNPDAILVRSFNMHAIEFGNDLKSNCTGWSRC